MSPFLEEIVICLLPSAKMSGIMKGKGPGNRMGLILYLVLIISHILGEVIYEEIK